MRTVGNIALFAWIALIVLSLVLPYVLKGASFRWMLKRRLQLVILALMITWIMLLSLSGLFGGSQQS